jgi:signal transduction histidine kinase/DNA-binding response OmpR family regulator
LDEKWITVRRNMVMEYTKELEKTLMAGIPGGIAIYHLKKDGRVTTEFVSESLAKMCGYEADEFLEYLRADSRVNLVAEDVPRVMETANKCLAQNQPINVIYRIYTKEKKPIMIRLDANVIKEEEVGEDEIAVLYAVHTLVSDESKKRMQEQKHYRDILNVLGVAYWEWSKENGYYSSESYAEYAISEEPDENIWDTQICHKYIHPEDVELYDKYVKKGGSDTTRTSAIVRTLMKDGSYHWTEMFAFAELDEAENVTRIISVMREVDREWLNQKEQLKIALEDSKKANQAKTDFLSRVSHDMRTPLNGILGITSLLQDYVTDKKVKSDLYQLELAGKYLLNLINDTLDVSKIESGKVELNPVICDGRTVFNNALGLVAQNMKEKNIKFHVHAENLPFTTLYLDVGRVQQIIMNVIGNAIKFTPEEGTIQFHMTNLSVKNGIITDKIEIEDNGVGMSPEFLPHLFEPFSQERNTSTSSSNGTGLGMTITKQIVELMGGSIEVESTLGKGTKFTLVLPMQIASEEQIQQWKKNQRDGRTIRMLDGRHVLLCEDHPLNANIATRLLKNKGILVDHVENGQLGVEKFNHSPIDYYDAILMDIRMPVMNGIDATRAIRELARKDAKQVPIIAMTANALISDIKETEEAGMNAHLSKPIEIDKLYDTLQDLILRKNEFQRGKILIVDDVKVNRAVIAAAIMKEFDVLEAEDGEEALKILKENRGIEAVITDIQMPGMNGLELIKKIRQNPDYRYIAVIANTQYGEPEQEEYLLNIGADDFVYKPTTPKIVEMRLHNVLKNI